MTEPHTALPMFSGNARGSAAPITQTNAEIQSAVNGPATQNLPLQIFNATHRSAMVSQVE